MRILKIGILTKYYNNRNYGGLLQAYALVTYLNNQGYNAEQISYAEENLRGISRYCFGITRLRLKARIIFFIDRFKARLCKHSKDNIAKETEEKLEMRYKSMQDFEKSIPHSCKYTAKNILNANDKYDTFIVGSDQVWNLEWHQKAYFHDFAKMTKLKIAYAASMPKTKLYRDQRNYLLKALKNFDHISVREITTERYLRDKLNIEVTTVVDPTFLLSKEDWDKIAEERLVDEKYVFCYFLSRGERMRKAAEEFAKRKGLLCVTLPYLSMNNVEDKDFGDNQLYNIRPEGFLSLIKYADYIFTDSFHGTVFSNLYHKNFFVFQRGTGVDKYMSSRIVDLLKVVGEEERLKDENVISIEELVGMKNIDYTNNYFLMEQKIENSKKFLKSVLS